MNDNCTRSAGSCKPACNTAGMPDITSGLGDFSDGVCIHTDQVYDSCREYDCA